MKRNPANEQQPPVVMAYAVSDSSNIPSAPAHPTSSSTAAAALHQSWPLINEQGVRDFLTGHRWPIGLQSTVIQSFSRVPIRFFICDDSGSMATNDGHRLLTDSHNQVKMVNCSRWAELTDSFKFHLGLANAAGSNVEIRLLNSLAPIRLGQNADANNAAIVALNDVFNESPGGGTPLCAHIRSVIEQIRVLEPQLRSSGQKACVVIATDGESSDGDIVAALRPLEQMPVWVVVRLCTDESKIVDYWNNIDGQLELG